MNIEYKSKPVCQYTPSGVLVQRYESVSEAARNLSLSKSQYGKLCSRVDSNQKYLESYWYSADNLPWTNEQKYKLF